MYTLYAPRLFLCWLSAQYFSTQPLLTTIAPLSPVLAGILFENWSRGLRRHIWLSVSTDLYLDAQRDLRDIGAGHIKSVALHKLPYAPIELQEGIVFVTYSSLIASSGTI